MKSFSYHIILGRDNICNYKNEQKLIKNEIANGQRLVLFGRRNTGKTSLIKSIIIPEFKKANKNGLAVFVDLMGVKTMEQIGDRMRIAFQESFSQAFPKKATFDKMVQLIRGLRPKFTVDQMTGKISLTVESTDENKSILFGSILKEIDRIHKKTKSLIVFDEFQDISLIPQAEGLMRDALQNLSPNLAVIILGSKKHLLSKIFADSNAPFANWGLPMELPRISAKDYQQYINDRLIDQKLNISKELTQYLLNLVQHIPESVNQICYMIQSDKKNKGDVTKEMIHNAIAMVLNRFEPYYLEFLTTLTQAELDFLVALANSQPLAHPRSKNFTRQLSSSPAASSKMLKKLLDLAIIYKIEEGYVVGDPILAMYLVKKMGL